MNCHKCSFKRDVDLPYRPATSPDIICCHPEIANQSDWSFAGKIITMDGSNPEWCPLIEPPKPCEHLRNTNCIKPWCNGIEYFWEDCCKSDNKYKIDIVCYDKDLINQQIQERVNHTIQHEELIKENHIFGC